MEALDLPAWLALLIAVLAALRVWRLLAVDDAGAPVRRLAEAGLNRTTTKIHDTLWDGWFCPFCFGFWLTIPAVASCLAWSDSWPWQLIAGTLAGSWILGQLGARLDSDEAEAEVGEQEGLT